MKYLLLAVGAFCLVATHAFADQAPIPKGPKGKVKLEMFVLHATTQGAGFDKKIPAELQRRLKRPPYSAHTRYTLLTRRNAQVAYGTPLLVNLPDRSVLRLSARPAGKRCHVKAEIKLKTGKKFLPNLQTRVGVNKLFVISGHKHNKGTLVVGVRLTAK